MHGAVAPVYNVEMGRVDCGSGRGVPRRGSGGLRRYRSLMAEMGAWDPRQGGVCGPVCCCLFFPVFVPTTAGLKISNVVMFERYVFVNVSLQVLAMLNH